IQPGVRNRRIHELGHRLGRRTQIPSHRRERFPRHRFPGPSGRPLLPAVIREAGDLLTIDVARAREETPGCASVVHFNNAGASLMPRAVSETVLDHLRLESAIGGYEAEARATDALGRVYDSLAELV